MAKSGVRAFLLVVVCFVGSSGTAAVLTWDPAGNGSGSGGNGTWNTQSWFNGASDVAWTANDAVFQGTGGAVQLTTGVSATSLTFNANNYAIVGGNTLTMSGANPTVTVGAGCTDSISCLVAGNSGLTTAGAGTLVLYANNTYTGGTTVTGGTLVAGAAALGTTPGRVTVASGATLSVNGGTNANQSGVGLSAIYFPITFRAADRRGWDQCGEHLAGRPRYRSHGRAKSLERKYGRSVNKRRYVKLPKRRRKLSVYRNRYRS